MKYSSYISANDRAKKRQSYLQPFTMGKLTNKLGMVLQQILGFDIQEVRRFLRTVQE